MRAGGRRQSWQSKLFSFSHSLKLFFTPIGGCTPKMKRRVGRRCRVDEKSHQFPPIPSLLPFLPSSEKVGLLSCCCCAGGPRGENRNGKIKISKRSKKRAASERVESGLNFRSRRFHFRCYPLYWHRSRRMKDP